MMDYNALAQVLRNMGQSNQPAPLPIGRPSPLSSYNTTPQNGGQQQQDSPYSSILRGASKYNDASGGKLTQGIQGLFGAGGGATGGAISSAMPAMSAGGGSSLGSMGLMSQGLPSAASMGFGGAGSGAAAGTGGGGFLSGLGGMFGGGAGAGAAGAGGASSGLMSAAMSNPWTAAAAAIIGGANYLDNKGISSWGDTIKGQAGGNILDYYGGRDDGKTHGLFGKLVSKDGAFGQSSKAVTDFSELDFSNAFENAGDAVKNIFKLKFW